MSCSPLPGNKVLCLSGDHSKAFLDAQADTELDKLTLRSRQFKAAFLHLQATGYHPEVVLWHTGWGCGLHLREVWPQARLVGYLEWWFAEPSPLESYEQHLRLKTLLPHQQCKNFSRNAALQQEAALADAMVCPTYWQLSQFPVEISRRAHVIHEGFNYSGESSYGALRSPTPLITYGTRGMEPMREFELLTHELTSFLPAYPDVRVEIAGEDKSFYSSACPFNKHGSWEAWARQRFLDCGVDHQVSFLGRLDKKRYISWVRSSWLHLYLTRPFVVGWSLLDSMAAGTVTTVTDLPITKEVTGQAAIFSTTRASGWLSKAWSKATKDSSLASKAASRALRYDSNRCAHSLRALCQGLLSG